MIVQVTLAGLVIVGADWARIVEEPRQMAPFLVRPPFAHVGAGSWAEYEGWWKQPPPPAPPSGPPNDPNAGFPGPFGEPAVIVVPPVYWSWWVGTLFISQEYSCTIRITEGAIVKFRVMRFGESPAMVERIGWRFNPCDIDLDGTPGTVNDLMTFASAPYDWNGDGATDAADFLAIMQRCN